MSERAVWSCNEWDPLEEVVLGIAENAQYPSPDISCRSVIYPHLAPDALPNGSFGEKLIEETSEDLDHFSAALQREGVVVRRPTRWEHANLFSTANWQARGFHNYCPRDTLLVIGDTIIETPGPVRSRFFETWSYRDILLDCMRQSARWISAPRPMLLDDLFRACNTDTKTLPNDEIIFDAANILRLGRDLLYLVSRTGNLLGAEWLKTVLGDSFRVHAVPGVYSGSHIDSTFVALRPGLMLCNPERVNEDNLPPLLKRWDIIYCPPLEKTVSFSKDDGRTLIGSSWIDMNLFSIRPDLVVVESNQLALIKVLESYKINVLPLRMRHSRELGGGFHCVTLDIRRRGKLECYF